MTFTDVLQILQTLSIIVAMVVAFGTIRGRGDDKVVALTEMQVDIRYIKEKVGGIDELRTDTTKAMQSAASAHHRLDDHLKYDHHQQIPERSKS